MTGSLHWLDAQGVEVAIRTWGQPSAPLVVAWHGFARTSIDFATLAESLSQRYFVVAPDTPGRGLSQWLPAQRYGFDTYCTLAEVILDTYGKNRPTHWIGTSMGGIIGLLLAERHPSVLQRLVLNDIGPEVPQAALDRIRSYTGVLPEFQTLQEAEAYFREVYTPFGPLTDTEWARLVSHSLRRTDGGLWTPHYDPAINRQFGTPPRDSALAWERFAEIPTPILVIRGETSDLLTPEITARMCQVGTDVHHYTVPGAGHAPYLNRPQDAHAILRFFGSS
ncbi:MAG: alpha/beta hydrolase [Gammaproteobacteria bacterium]|nr:alpha/beta hydrolase [Gammaproteobacteria bacterium]